MPKVTSKEPPALNPNQALFDRVAALLPKGGWVIVKETEVAITAMNITAAKMLRNASERRLRPSKVEVRRMEGEIWLKIKSEEKSGNT